MSKNIAAGPNHIVLTVNNRIEIYNKDGDVISQNAPYNFFSSKQPPGEPYDPRVVFDQFYNRWIIFVLWRPSGSYSPSNYMIAVSQSSDPTGGWYYYNFNAKLDNGNSTNNHADYTSRFIMILIKRIPRSLLRGYSLENIFYRPGDKVISHYSRSCELNNNH